jgi:Leucine-rich repeat (LRR) protein
MTNPLSYNSLLADTDTSGNIDPSLHLSTGQGSQATDIGSSFEGRVYVRKESSSTSDTIVSQKTSIKRARSDSGSQKQLISKRSNVRQGKIKKSSIDLPNELFTNFIIHGLKVKDIAKLRIAGMQDKSLAQENMESAFCDALNQGKEDLKGIGCKTIDAANDFIRRNGNRITNLDLGCFSSELSNKNLQMLLSHPLPFLQRLDLSDCNLTNDSLAFVSGLSSLQSLNLTNNTISDEGLLHLNGLSSLEKLDLSGNSILGPGLSQITALQALETLALLDLGVADSGLIHLRNLSSLRNLHISAAGFSDHSFELIKAIGSLRTFDLRNSSINANDLEQIKEFEQLENLHLYNCDIEETNQLALLKELSSLKALYLIECFIVDDDLFHIKDLTTLQVLDLWCNEISDYGLVHLKGLHYLRKLGLGDNSITKEGFDTMRESLSETSFIENLSLPGYFS